jgi:hypothetical protein
MENQHSLYHPISHKSDLTLILACHQFPVHLTFAMTINKAKDNLSSMCRLACEDLCSHMVNSMWHSHRPPLTIRSMFYFYQGTQGPRPRM